jgi:hypothetical protein
MKLLPGFSKAISYSLMITTLLTTNIALASETVNIDNFVRAETDTYLKKREASGYFGKLVHLRQVIDIDNQPVIRGNRDTLYSYGVFDLTTPVSITLPEHDRFQSIRVINQDHYILYDTTKPGKYVLTKEKAGSRYVHVNVRTLVNPDDEQDVIAAHAQQNKVVVKQEKAGALELPEWNLLELGKLRKAILSMTPFVPNSLHMFGSKDEVTEVRHLIGTAAGWGGGAAKAVLFLNETPEKNDGKTPYSITVKDVPVDGFWSISVYNSKGYFEKNPYGAYSLNNLTAKPDADGSITIHFGGDPKEKNYLYISKGWNYTVRMYLPRKEVLDGSWTFPKATLK